MISTRAAFSSSSPRNSGLSNASYRSKTSYEVENTCSGKKGTNVRIASKKEDVRLFDIGDVPYTNGGRPSEQRVKFDHRAPVLACAWGEGGSTGKAYSGGLDTGVRELDLEKESMTHLGTHGDGISSMVWSKETNNLITGSWDRTLRFWDPRASSSSNAPASPTSSSPIAVEYFDPSPEVQEKKYAFKCHRQTVKEVDQASGKEQEVDHVWPVNGLAFCPRYNTFASAGSDGTVSIWDFKVKKRLRQYPKFPNPVSAIGFSCDGGKLAIVHARPASSDRRRRPIPARSAYINTGDGEVTGMDGYRVGRVRVIFSLPVKAQERLFNSEVQCPELLAYVEWYTPIPAAPDHNTLLYKISTMEEEGGHICSIIPLSDIRRSVHLYPKFGPSAPVEWTSSTLLYRIIA
ncbi:spindle assembly checkpoint protein SLDB [Coprinopsis cinerea AmutBmut pab1-1]|nr:spindle assembly checkpoint protein SLDB [Coprinopsis cinerea AmutBmut pab1-1]